MEVRIQRNQNDRGCELLVLAMISNGSTTRRKEWLRSTSLALCFLLILHSFAQAHLIEVKPFRVADTDLSGGDHICDLRRDRNGDGKPDRLGDYLQTSGTVIAKPATFDSDGWLFWIRQDSCAIMVYGERESYRLGDSILVSGQLRITNGGYFFPETGMATLGDLAIENEGTLKISSGCWHDPIDVEPHDFIANPHRLGGNLIRLRRLAPLSMVGDQDGNIYGWFCCQEDSISVYIDADTKIALDPNLQCLDVVGIVVRMKVPEIFSTSPLWCIAPRCQADLTQCQISAIRVTTWGKIKSEFSR